MPVGQDLLGGPPPTLLPDEVEPRTALESGEDPAAVAARFPTHSAAWAALADDAFGRGAVIESYAYARVGYHRGLDALRRNGWKGYGPVPWEHEPNRGFLRSLHALGRAAASIGETDEAQRCQTFLDDSDPTASANLARWFGRHTLRLSESLRQVGKGSGRLSPQEAPSLLASGLSTL